MKAIVFAVVGVFCATTAVYAQSQPNYGANPPPGADSFGQPPTGYLPPGVSRYVPPRAYSPPPNRYPRHRHYRQTQPSNPIN